MLNVGGQYAYLSQYVFACYTPAVSGANLPANGTSSGMMSRADAVTSPKTPSSAQGPPTKGSADCFVVGGM